MISLRNNTSVQTFENKLRRGSSIHHVALLGLIKHVPSKHRVSSQTIQLTFVALEFNLTNFRVLLIFVNVI